VSGVAEAAPRQGPPDFSHLAGHAFPGGSYTLAPHEAWLWADAVGATPDPGFAHPEIAYMVGLHGGGASIGQIMELLEADEDSGVLFGELEFEFDRPLRPGTTYEVAGHVISVERKQGRKAGVFDRATFVHELTAAGDPAPSARITHVWIFPRGDGS
jgi:hypothetical protein